VHAKTYFVTMARYNLWMNGRIYDCAGQLSDAERKRDRGAFFKSIHGTLNHILLGDRLWLGRFSGEAFTGFSQLDDTLYADFGELRTERARTDKEILDFVDGLDEARISGELRYTTFVNPAARAAPLWQPLMHFFNHQTHHRGQVTTLLFQAGVDPGVTDLIYLPDMPKTA
jgi:uncharacterized damage-inducible protein DinB